MRSKLFVPPAHHDLIVRPRLLERLTAALQHKLTLICAPAGFGKTTLLSKWVTESPRPVVWLSLESSDSDLRRFLRYFTAALQTLKPGLGKRLLYWFRINPLSLSKQTLEILTVVQDACHVMRHPLSRGVTPVGRLIQQPGTSLRLIHCRHDGTAIDALNTCGFEGFAVDVQACKAALHVHNTGLLSDLFTLDSLCESPLHSKHNRKG